MPKLFAPKPVYPPRCPFCRQFIAPPQPLDSTDNFYEFDGGVCACGAVYSLDPTARNGGAVLMEVLARACNGDYDRAMGLNPQEDCDEGHVGKYNSRTHRVGEPGSFSTLYFIRLKQAPPE